MLKESAHRELASRREGTGCPRGERCLRSSAGQRATELREAHREKVARNEVRVDELWARPCVAYNVQIELDPRSQASLGKRSRH